MSLGEQAERDVWLNVIRWVYLIFLCDIMAMVMWKYDVRFCVRHYKVHVRCCKVTGDVFLLFAFPFRFACLLVLTFLSRVTIGKMSKNDGEPLRKKIKLDANDKGKLFLFF